MAVNNSILGLNARNYLYIKPYNRQEDRKLADNKLKTKQILEKAQIPTPKVLSVFDNRDQVKNIDWQALPSEFVVKPASGYGGAGILIFESWNGEFGITVTGEKYNTSSLLFHLMEILDGAYSLEDLADQAFIEERVHTAKFFNRFQAVGLPDIRVVVFQTVPIMAMVRVPTKESNATANVHRGAIGIGIDIATGITTTGVYKEKTISKLPHTNMKIRGFKLPLWDEILELASNAQQASGLGYAAIDVVVDEQKGSMVMEINARPGLSIQIANDASLRGRLERIEGLDVHDSHRGVALAKLLFAAPFASKVPQEFQTVSVFEDVGVMTKNGIELIKAKIDTGAFRTSLDIDLAKKLGIDTDTARTAAVHSASGYQTRKVVPITLILRGKKFSSEVSLADRSQMRFPMIVGRRDLKNYIIEVSKSNHEGEEEILEEEE